MDEFVKISIEADSTATEILFVKQLSNCRFLLADTPVITGFQDEQLHAGDIVDVEPTESGHFRITSVERSNTKHYDLAITREFAESKELSIFCDEVTAAGGTWERVMGGLLYVHLPPESDFDAEAALSRRVALARAQEPK